MLKISLKILIIFLSFFSLNVYASEPLKVVVVDSYHPEYGWASGTQNGLLQGLLDDGYLDSQEQFKEIDEQDAFENDKLVYKRFWMDTKRKNTQYAKAEAALKISEEIRLFHPDIIFLGDDNAANYIGNEFLDTHVPIIFWGVNNTPVKYGLLDSIDYPGHNVTGVYQPGYYVEGFDFLRKVQPHVKKIAILTTDTTSGRAHQKKVEALVYNGTLSVEIIGTVVTEYFEDWKLKAKELESQVDAFFIGQTTGLRDSVGTYVNSIDVINWQIENIKKPELSTMSDFVEDGMLLCAEDSSFKQGYEAFGLGMKVVRDKQDISKLKPIYPSRGDLILNVNRAKELGIVLSEEMGIEKKVGIVDA